MKRHISVLALAALMAVGWGVSFVAAQDKPANAIFAGGHFWSLQPAFEAKYGVMDVVSGYTGGTGRNPNYRNYAQEGFVEAVKVTYDPALVTYEDLLDLFWHHTNPTDAGGQFRDRGPQYRTIVFWNDETERSAAEISMAQLAKSGRFSAPIVTEMRKADAFYSAESNLQDYAKKNPRDYERYVSQSGRDQFFAKTWGQSALLDPAAPPSAKDGNYHKPSVAELRRLLNPMQFEVTQQEGTEPAFDNEYWNNHEAGIYVDIVSGEPLFSSTDKYDSHTGWPSFTRPLEPDNFVTKIDVTFGMVRTEVKSKYAGSHLGHIFPDGPAPTGLRYCMDSASLRFIPAADLVKDGYGQYAYLFKM